MKSIFLDDEKEGLGNELDSYVWNGDHRNGHEHAGRKRAHVEPGVPGREDLANRREILRSNEFEVGDHVGLHGETHLWVGSISPPRLTRIWDWMNESVRVSHREIIEEKIEGHY